eukprot:gene18491-16461_t
MAATEVKVDVKYLGYVHTDIKGGGRPGMVQVKLAQSMLMKKNLKKTRQEHPLFARGFDSKLRMEISEKGLFVALPAGESKSSKEECLMNQSMNKIAFVSSIGKTLYVMMKRTGAAGRFKCHAFGTASEAEATQLTQTLSRIANEVFAKLRHVTRLLEAQAKKGGGPPVVPKRAVIKDEDQPWFHGKVSRPNAEALLKEQAMTNGLFLVRQSDRNETDFVLTFCYSQRAYHNRIIKQGDGTYKNTKGSSWNSLALIVADYMNPHEDMQTVITEYVPNNPPEGGGEYANVSLLQEAAAAAMAQKKTVRRWDTSAIQAALGEIDEMGEPQSAIATSEDGNDIAYDPVYDEIQFGFGDEFIKTTLGLTHAGAQPKMEFSLENDMFSLGDIEGECEV